MANDAARPTMGRYVAKTMGQHRISISPAPRWSRSRQDHAAAAHLGQESESAMDHVGGKERAGVPAAAVSRRRPPSAAAGGVSGGGGGVGRRWWGPPESPKQRPGRRGWIDPHVQD
jgi:hypothetical protein